MQTSVLWADRNCVFTVLGRHYLEAAGMAVETVETAVDCIRRLKLGSHDILILDDSLLWGGVEGILWWIGDSLPRHDQPEILVSGVEQPARLSSKTGVPLERCLQKPYRLMTVLDAVLAAQGSLKERHPYETSRRWEAVRSPILNSGHLLSDVAVRIRGSRQSATLEHADETLGSAELTVCGIKDVAHSTAGE